MNREDCVKWWGSFSPQGYGIIQVEGKQQLAHRYIYESAYGEIPYGCDLHHKCENKWCINPYHLEPLTRSEHFYTKNCPGFGYESLRRYHNRP